MISFSPFPGSLGLLRAAFCGATLVVTGLASFSAGAAGEFPFDRELILEAKRIGNLRRLPILTVEPNGNAVIDLWCKTVPGRVTIAGSSIRIEAPPLPEQLPDMMVAGQCSPERLQADEELLAALTQVSDWHMQGYVVVLNGPTALHFNPSSH